jgi:hypothetical protein
VLRLLAFLFSVGFLLATRVDAQEFEMPSVTISAGDLEHAVELAPADADAFRRRVNQLPRLEDPPSVAGEPYIVTTSYWAVTVRLEEDEDALDVSVRGDYYADGGYVRVTLENGDAEDSEDAEGPEDVWMVLSLRQRAILDRYIRLANDGLIGETPLTLEVLGAAAATEVFGVQLGTRTLARDETATFWSLISSLTSLDILRNPEFTPPGALPHVVWITVTLPEGRSVRFVYNAVAGTLVEPLSQDVYPVSKDWLSPILGGYDVTTIGTTLTSTIVQEEPPGSLLWWPVMAGGGLVAIGAAVWLRRRAAPTP